MHYCGELFYLSHTYSFFPDITFSKKIIGSTNSSLLICIFYFILTRFNKFKIISQKFRLLDSKYYNGLLLLVIISYFFLAVLYIGMTEQTKEYINFGFFILIPIYMGAIFHIINMLSKTLNSDEKMDALFLPIKQKK